MRKGSKHTKETIKKMGISHKKNPVRYWLGKHLTIETKKKLSKSHKGLCLRLGKHHTQSTKEKISKSKRGVPNIKNSLKMRKIKVDVFEGYVTKKDRRERLRFRNELQKAVFERDNYTCQLCGKRGVALQVDHIQSWAEYVQLRFCIDNCRTLCAQCHYKITFGKPMPPTVRAWGHNFKKGVKHNEHIR